jgi:hypothetical protein
MAIWFVSSNRPTQCCQVHWLQTSFTYSLVPKEDLHTKQTLAESKKLFRAEEKRRKFLLKYAAGYFGWD